MGVTFAENLNSRNSSDVITYFYISPSPPFPPPIPVFNLLEIFKFDII